MMLVESLNHKIKSLSQNFLIVGLSLFLLSANSVYAAPQFKTNIKKIGISQPIPLDMAVADFNKDGFIDVVIPEYLTGDGTAGVEIFLGNIDTKGNFGNPVTLKLSGVAGDGLFFVPGGLAVGDVTGDGILDVAVTAGLTPAITNENLFTYIFLGSLDINSKYTLLPTPKITIKTQYPSRDVVIGKFNNDVFVDIVIAHERGLSVFLGTAVGVFDPKELHIVVTGKTSGPNIVYADYMNDDLYLDLVTDNEILFNNNILPINNTIADPTKAFTRKAFYASSFSTAVTKDLVAVTIGEFNGDNIKDVAYTLNYTYTNGNPTASQVVVLNSVGTGNNVSYLKKETALIPSSSLSHITTGDIDLDGVDDVIVTDNIQDAVRIYTGEGKGVFSAPVTITISPPTGGLSIINPSFLAVVKANNDLFPDIITANAVDNQNPTLSVLIQTDPGKESFVFGQKNYVTSNSTGNKIQLPIKVLRKYPLNALTIVNFTAVDAGFSAKNGIDFVAPLNPTNIDFPVGVVQNTINIEILPTNNPDSNFSIELRDSVTALLDTTTVSITNNTPVPQLSFSSANFNLFEDQTKVTQITVIRTPLNTLTTTTVEVSTVDSGVGTGFATITDDYTQITSKILTFASGVDSQSFTIPIVDDVVVDPNEMFQIKLLNPVNATILSPTTTVTIIDNNIVIPPVNQIPLVTPKTYTAIKNKMLTIDAPGVLFEATDADQGDTLTAKLASGSSLTGLALKSDGSFTYLSPTQDFVGKITFEYVANDGTADSLLATVTIDVFDPARVKVGVFSLDANNTYTVSEDSGELILNVVRNTGTSGVVNLAYEIINTTANAGEDFNDKTPTLKKLKFLDGVKSMPITIEIVKDGLQESDEEFVVSLNTVDAGVLANMDTSKVVTITDSVSTAPIVSNGSGGGGCSLQIQSRFDPVIPLLLLLTLLYFSKRVRLVTRLLKDM